VSVVEARDIWKAFFGTVALKGASLSVESGSIHALIGENGAGKSTLIKILTGVHRADRGTVMTGGQERHFESPQAAIEAGISAVFQERNLVPDFSVAERWFGVYAKHFEKPYLRFQPEDTVEVVTGLGGAGMTLSFGVAAETFDRYANGGAA